MFEPRDVCLIIADGRPMYARIDDMVVRGDTVPGAIGYDVHLTLLTYPKTKRTVWQIADFHMDGREFGMGPHKIQIFPVPLPVEEDEKKEVPPVPIVGNVVRGNFGPKRK